MRIHYKKTYAEKKAEKKAWLAGQKEIERMRAAGEYDDMALIYEKMRELEQWERERKAYNTANGPDNQIPPVIG